jgi:hypothetical protein
MDLTVRLYFALEASRIYGGANFELRQRVFNEIASGHEYWMRAWDGSEVAFSVDRVEREAVPAAVRGEDYPIWLDDFFLATAKMSIGVERMTVDDQDLDIPATEIAYHFASGEAQKFLGDLALAANLGKPGSVEVEWASVSIDGYDRATSLGPFHNSLADVVRRAQKFGWPALIELDIGKVWRWAQGLDGFAAGMARGRVGRALAAASFLILAESEGAPADLTWALMGLEALFSRGTQGLKAQIIEKSAVLLGRPKAFRKKFDGIYDYRSRFVHGDLDIPLAHCRHYATSEIESFDSEVDECKLLATAILIAALQRCVDRGWHSLDFDYVIRDTDVTREA